ncbi:DNA/RNA helicase domain-containing protein [Pedobacter endophyticus]|uniref:DUF2075 domain-containing protein n=1 Tax=Pedobacter endophyticus TaxID=2789740 RepID=A0A7S9L169_9SPHI|nr:DNA/RNA helicase domain-containing protein [Pedobacter endophyticus]QPH40384.1 DUF2075 domain-containing protein [Pedobacter endophyticus]
MNNRYLISQSDFSENSITDLSLKHSNYTTWPLVYFLSEDKKHEAYVGETTDLVTRMRAHLKSDKKSDLKSIHLILSDLFNKSATLDIEANLIKYLAADGKYQLKNGNLGIANHQFYQQKEVYWDLFKDIWSELRTLGITRHSLDHLDNSDLFKYSPYKSLSIEQVEGLKTILKCLLDDNAKVSLIEGGAGTGKSILAIFLFKLLNSELEDFDLSDFDETDLELFDLFKRVKAKYLHLEMALVIPMSSFRKTISKVFKGIKGLKSNMVIGPAEVVRKKYDLLIVDESHRLRQRVNLGSYFYAFDQNCKRLGLDKMSSSELDWVLSQSNKSILFYDEQQSIKPSDVDSEQFKRLKQSTSTRYETLKTQLRIKGGPKYINFIHNLFHKENKISKPYLGGLSYEAFLYESLDEMVSDIKLKNQQFGLARLVAGFAWKWISRKDKSKFDIVINETRLQWNSVTIDWMHTPNAVNEVGCIHTIQGYDLNYAGIIIGPEIGYDPIKGEIIINEKFYQDKNGKNSIKDYEVLKNYIINIYQTVLLRGIRGTFIYVCDLELRNHFKNYWTLKRFERDVQELVTYNYKLNEQCIPFYDLSIAAGSFSEYQQVENVKYIELPDNLKANTDYFACKIVGESMNKVIPNGAIALFKKYTGGSRNGLICLVESTNIYDKDLGGQYTIKEYRSRKTITEDSWQHEEISLHPLSTDMNFETIVLRDEETIDFKVIGEFVRVL